MAEPKIERELIDKVDEWVSCQLEGCEPKRFKTRKIFKDPVWGMTQLTPIEICIVDTPIFQRLRRIHQTGLAFLTYPAALHTRFDHSIGMLNCASKIVNAINARCITRGRDPEFNERVIQEIRLAAILHDTGHACLSHLTEPFFKGWPAFDAMKESINQEKGVEASNHEIISSLIAQSESFISYFERCVELNYPRHIDDPRRSAQNISDMIIGAPINNKYEKSYISEVVNGPYDADKLDYIFRDSYFTGISLSTDIEKFIYALTVESVPQTGKRSLVIDVGGASAYDQLVFSKISLSTNVYNHQKVMATNEMVRGILEIMSNQNVSIAGKSLDDPVKFLSLTDWELLTGQTDNEQIRGLQVNIRNRKLLQRLFRISCHVVTDERLPKDLANKLPPKLSKDIGPEGKVPLHRVEDLRKKICRHLHIQAGEAFGLRIGLPILPKIMETVDAYCMHYNGEIVEFNEISPLPWAEAYKTNKWVAYIYAAPKYCTDENNIRAKDFLEKEYNTKFNETARMYMQ